MMDRDAKDYLKNIDKSFGSDFKPQIFLEVSLKIMDKYNAYWWCSRGIVYDYLDFVIKNKFNYDILVWNKLNPLPTKNNKYLPNTEICIFMRDNIPYFNNDLPFDFYRKVYNHKILTRIDGCGHPTPKPLLIIEKQILISSKENDIICDLFGGSGTTAFCAKKHNRKFIIIEISKEYCGIIKERLRQNSLF